MRLGSRRTLFQAADCITSRMYVVSYFFTVFECLRVQFTLVLLNGVIILEVSGTGRIS